MLQSGMTDTPNSTGTNLTHARVAGRSICLSRTGIAGAALSARRIFLTASPLSTNLSIRETTSRNRAGGICPLRHIWRDELYTKASAKPGGYDSANKLPTRPGFGHGINPACLLTIWADPGAFCFVSGVVVRTIITMSAIGGSNRSLADCECMITSLNKVYPLFYFATLDVLGLYFLSCPGVHWVKPSILLFCSAYGHLHDLNTGEWFTTIILMVFQSLQFTPGAGFDIFVL